MKLISHLKGFSEKESSWLIGRSSALDVVKRYPHVPRLSNVTLTVHTFAFDHHKKISATALSAQLLRAYATDDVVHLQRSECRMTSVRLHNTHSTA